MSRRVWWLRSRLLLALAVLGTMAMLVSACTSPDPFGDDASDQGSAGEEDEPADAPSLPTDPTIPEDRPGTLPGGPPGSEALAELPGRLAVTSGSVLLILDPDGANREVLDDVANGSVSQPTWAPDGTLLAWVRDEATVASLELIELETEGRESFETPPSPAIYLQWNDESTALGLLQNRPGGLALSTVSRDEPARIRATDAPLFFSWAPGGDRLAVHRGSALIVDDGGRETELVADTGATFSAPYWLGDSAIVAARDGELVRIDIGSRGVQVLGELAGPTQFVVNPNDRLVAYLAPGTGITSIQTESAAAPPTLRVLDITTGSEILVSDDRPLAWEWSPDGSRLAFLAPSEFEPELLRWYFWERGNLIGATTAHLPTDIEKAAYLPFFAQYAQSHTRWSGGSDAFAFAGTIDEQQGVWVHVLGETPQSILVSDGDFVTWSPDSVAGGSGVSIL